MKMDQQQDAYTRLRASVLSLLGGGLTPDLGRSVHLALPQLKPHERIVKRLLALTDGYHKGVVHASRYAFDPRTRKIWSPLGLKGDLGAMAHEVGHAMDPVMKRVVRPQNALSNAGSIGGMLGAAMFPERERSRSAALVGSALTLPRMAHETYAGIKGMQLLRQTSRKIPVKVLLRAMSGLPSYAGLTAAPLAVYGIRSALGGFGDK